MNDPGVSDSLPWGQIVDDIIWWHVIVSKGRECPRSDNVKDFSSIFRSCGDRGMGKKKALFKRISGRIKTLEEFYFS